MCAAVPVKKPTLDRVPLARLNDLGFGSADIQAIQRLDTNRDQFLDATEVAAALLGSKMTSRAASLVVGRFFTEGLSQTTLRPRVVATFNAIVNPALQYQLLMSLDSSAQARLIQAAAQKTSRSDLAYVWYEFVFSESGVLGGILLNHLHALDPALGDSIFKEALDHSGASELRKQLQAHSKNADALVAWTPAQLIYFPSADAASHHLAARKIHSTTTIPQELKTVVPKISGMQSRGVVVAIREGRGYIMTPETGFTPPRFAVAVAHKVSQEELTRRYAEGKRFLDEGNHDEAIRAYEGILVVEPTELLAYLRIGQVYNSRGNQYERSMWHYYQLAVRGWDALLQKDPRYFDSRMADRIHYNYAVASIDIIAGELSPEND